jgi:hypothetical protein
MSVTREEILLSLGIDHSTIAAGLQKAESIIASGVKGITSVVKNLGGSMLAGFAFAEIGSKMGEVIERVETLSNRAKALTISNDFLQDIENVGKSAGVSGEAVEKMLIKFTRSLPAGRDVEQSFYEMANKLASIPDPAERARVAVDEFGREGVDMITIAGNGSAALQELASRFQKMSGDDIEGIKAANEQIHQLGNTLTVWTGKAIAAAAAGARFYGHVGSKGNGVIDILLGESHIDDDLMAEDMAKNEADQKREEARKKAERIDAANKETEENLKIWKAYQRKKSELDPDSAINRSQTLNFEKMGEERALKLSKSFAEEYSHKTRILEIEHEIRDIQKQQQAEQQQADNIRVQAAQRIQELSQRERDKFLPTLDELAHHGAFTSQARHIGRLDQRIKREFGYGDLKDANADIVARNKIYDSLADRGVVTERHERIEKMKIDREMRDALKHLASGHAEIVAKLALR